MHTESLSRSLVFRIEEASYDAGIFTLALAVPSITGKLVAFTVVDICDFDGRLKKSIHLGSPILLETF
jgi:hypothetical protein